ncbi:MAG: hypothetical protein WCD76_00345 [Pyrinomonadaceae bacterium]
MASNDKPERAKFSQTKLLAVSFAFPPLAYPRSIQVARLVKYLRLPVALVCADELDARRDPTLEPDAEAALAAVLRVPFSVSKIGRYANAAAHRFHRPLWNRWNRAPDQYRAWLPRALAAIERLTRDGAFMPDAIATFSQPVVDHLIGLELKKRYQLPWLAHFSDPWVDNPFYAYDEATRRINETLERRVIEQADRLVFTSRETIDLVMSKYPPQWKRKTLVLPQAFDTALYPPPSGKEGTRLTVRHLGNFYGQRTPAPLFRALRQLHTSDPSALRDVVFELVGIEDVDAVREAARDGLPEELISVGPHVGYRESLSLMSRADGLVVIDAPTDKSVFLPSKLIDYIGAGRPVLGLSPPGAASALINRLGGWLADPSDTEAGAVALSNFIAFLRTPESRKRDAWGAPDVRREYEATHLADSFAAIIEDLRTP